MDTQELEKLYNLKEKGIITEEQFNQKKQQILNGGKATQKVKVKREYTGVKKFFFYFFSLLSFFGLWGIICTSLFVFNYIWAITATLIVAATLLVFSAIFWFLGRILYRKLSAREDCEKFMRFSKIYTKVMLALTLILSVLVAGINVRNYVKNNGVHNEYYDNGSLKKKAQYEKGRCTGIVEEYYENGKLKVLRPCNRTEFGPYWADYLCENCMVKEYYENGKLRAEHTCNGNDGGVGTTYTVRDGVECHEHHIIKYYQLDNEFIVRNNIFYVENNSNVLHDDSSYIKCTYDGNFVKLTENQDDIPEDAAKLCKEYADKIKENHQ